MREIGFQAAEFLWLFYFQINWFECGDLNIWTDALNMAYTHFKGHAKTKDTEWEASWACVITGNLLRLSKEVSGLSACVIFSIQKSKHCSMAVRVIEVTLCARYGVFQAFKLSRMFICEVSCAHRRWFIMHLPEHEAIWSVRPSLH